MAAWCITYERLLFVLVIVFLVGATLAAILETWLTLKAKMKAGAADAKTAGALNAELTPAEITKLLDSVRALLETLKGLPAWVMLFLAGLSLTWLTADTPKRCLSSNPAGTQQTSMRK